MGPLDFLVCGTIIIADQPLARRTTCIECRGDWVAVTQFDLQWCVVARDLTIMGTVESGYSVCSQSCMMHAWYILCFQHSIIRGILALPGPNSTTVLGPGKRACKIASRSLWPGFASANQLSVWNASPQLLIHDHLPFSSSVILKDRVQNSRSWRSWRSQIKSTNQITRNQGNTGHTRRHHNQASRIFNMIGWW